MKADQPGKVRNRSTFEKVVRHGSTYKDINSCSGTQERFDRFLRYGFSGGKEVKEWISAQKLSQRLDRF